MSPHTARIVERLLKKHRLVSDYPLKKALHDVEFYAYSSLRSFVYDAAESVAGCAFTGLTVDPKEAREQVSNALRYCSSSLAVLDDAPVVHDRVFLPRSILTEIPKMLPEFDDFWIVCETSDLMTLIVDAGLAAELPADQKHHVFDEQVGVFLDSKCPLNAYLVTCLKSKLRRLFSYSTYRQVDDSLFGSYL